MSFCTDAIETVHLNPSFDATNLRTEFILEPNKVHLPTLRLTGIGLRQAAGAEAGNYNRLVGAHGSIKHIRLLDKGVEIDSCKFCNILQGFKNLNHSARHNDKVNTHLRRTELGFTHLSCNEGTLNVNTAIKSLIQAGRLPEGTNRNRVENNHACGDADIYLGEHLPILKSMNALSTSMFRHLKLVIEHEQVISRVLRDRVGVAQSTLTPVLVIDEVVDKETQQKLMASMKSIQWTSYEHDRFEVPEVTGLGANAAGRPEQRTEVKLNGPKNKSIGRVLIVKQLQDDADASILFNSNNGAIGFCNRGFGNVGSIQCQKEQYQLRINGANILPEGGVTKHNEQLALLTQTYGQMSMLPFAHFGSCPASGLDDIIFCKNANQDGRIADGDGNDSSKQLGCFGIAVNDYVQDFQLTYTRQNNGFANDDNAIGFKCTNKALSVHVYFEVQKMLQLQGGTCRIVYV